MRIRSTILVVTICILLLAGCHHKPQGPDDDTVPIHATIAIFVTDQNNNPIGGARVIVGPPGTLNQILTTNSAGWTDDFYQDGDTNTSVEIEVVIDGYVTAIDTFWLALEQPQYHHAVQLIDTGFIEGQVLVHVRDTANQPIAYAHVELRWFPGPLWQFARSPWFKTGITGTTDTLHMHVDPNRNRIIATVSMPNYLTTVDSFSITADRINEIAYNLHSP